MEKMSRAIKFRAWDIKNKEMISNATVLFEDNWTNPFIDTDFICMQYTGLKDKNGKEIYEGDILEFDAKEWGNDKTNRGVVCWNDKNGCWEGVGLNGEWSDWCEVIGNIYQNSELLGKE